MLGERLMLSILGAPDKALPHVGAGAGWWWGTTTLSALLEKHRITSKPTSTRCQGLGRGGKDRHLRTEWCAGDVGLWGRAAS